mgnify:CR=1 FL=1
MKKNYKILHFEDDKDFVDICSKSFEAHGFRYKNYEILPSEEENLVALVLSENPALIITKANMPGMNGYIAAKILKSTVPVMLLDNFNDSYDEEKYRDSGMKGGWDKKETTPEKFPESVKKLFERDEEDEINWNVKSEEEFQPTTERKSTENIGQYPEWVRVVFPFALWGIIGWMLIGSFPPGNARLVAGILIIVCFSWHMSWLSKNNTK